MVINFPKRTVTLQGHSMKPRLNDIEADTVNPEMFYCEQHTHIPPSTEVIIPATTVSNGAYPAQPLSFPSNQPGIRNLNADALSRLPHDTSDTSSSREDIPLFLADERRERTIKLQEEDLFLRPIIQHLKNPEMPVHRRNHGSARAFSLQGGNPSLIRRAKDFEKDQLALEWPLNKVNQRYV